jgi:hypothetical protein
MVRDSVKTKRVCPQLLACVLAIRSSNEECNKGGIFKLLGTALIIPVSLARFTEKTLFPQNK